MGKKNYLFRVDILPQQKSFHFKIIHGENVCELNYKLNSENAFRTLNYVIYFYLVCDL
jgi:hypothetical protein